MNPADWTGIIFGGIGAITGVIALLLSGKANKTAKDSNDIAEEANRISAESRDAAARANELAGNANKISENANLISQRSFEASRDQTSYRWTAEYDADETVITVVNDCGLTAHEVHAIISFDNNVIEERHSDIVAPYGQIHFGCAFVAKNLLEQGHVPGFITIPSVEVRFSIIWTTELGVRRSLESQQRFGNTKERKPL